MTIERAAGRLHGLDAVRSAALLLGVVLHSSLSFLPGSDVYWVVSDISSTDLLAPVFFVIHSVRMPTFFLLAGFFGRVTRERLGDRGFVRDRARRIGLPLLFGWPVLLGAMAAVIVWAASRANGGALSADLPPPPAFTANDFPLGHLWFLYVLLLLYVATMVLRAALERLDRSATLRGGLDRIGQRLGGSWVPMLLAGPLALSLYFHGDWIMWFGIPTPDRSLYPNLPAWIGFGGAFALGWTVHRLPALRVALERRAISHLALAIAAIVSSLAIVGTVPILESASRNSRTLAYAWVYSTAVWSGTLATVGLGLRFWSSAGPVRRYIADASYWTYLVHLPLVVALQVSMSQLNWPWVAKFPLVVAATCAACLGSYQLFVRHSVIGGILNGRHVPRGVAPATTHPRM